MAERAPLQTVLKLKQRELERVQAEHAKVIAARQAAEHAEQMARNRVLLAQPRSANSSEWALAELTKARLLKQAKDAAERAAELRESEAASAEQVRDAMAQAQAIERLLEERKREAQRSLDAKAQADLDAVATLRFLRGT